MLQQAQAAADVDGIAGDGHLGAVGQIGQGVVFAGVQAQVGEDASLHAGELESLAAHGIGQVIAVLVVVQVDVAGIQRDVGCGPVAEFDDLHIQALFSGFLGGDFHGVGEDAGDYADLERCGQHGAGDGQACQQCGEFGYPAFGDRGESSHGGPVCKKGQRGEKREPSIGRHLQRPNKRFRISFLGIRVSAEVRVVGASE